MTGDDAADRLPAPAWDRHGETWRVEAEPGWELVSDGLCMSRGCYRAAVVFRPRNPYAICAVHVRAGRMWIENGQLVSWVLRP